MRVKKVNRYYCEFCKKSGCAGGHMAKHELHCTMNPNRECRMCPMVGAETKPIADRLALLPNANDWERIDGAYDDALIAMIAEVTPSLRDLVGNCPMCILSTLKQANIPCGIVDGFDWKKESTLARNAHYAAQQEKELRENFYSYI